jgi:hypothetical protein
MRFVMRGADVMFSLLTISVCLEKTEPMSFCSFVHMSFNFARYDGGFDGPLSCDLECVSLTHLLINKTTYSLPGFQQHDAINATRPVCRHGVRIGRLGWICCNERWRPADVVVSRA